MIFSCTTPSLPATGVCPFCVWPPGCVKERLFCPNLVRGVVLTFLRCTYPRSRDFWIKISYAPMTVRGYLSLPRKTPLFRSSFRSEYRDWSARDKKHISKKRSCCSLISSFDASCMDFCKMSGLQKTCPPLANSKFLRRDVKRVKYLS